MGVRFKNQLFYTILGGGTHYLDFSDKFSASCFYRAGLSLPLCQRFSISGDLGYQHIETFKNESNTVPARLYALQARINLEYNITERFGIFCTGGYGISRPYTQTGTSTKVSSGKGASFYSEMLAPNRFYSFSLMKPVR